MRRRSVGGPGDCSRRGCSGSGSGGAEASGSRSAETMSFQTEARSWMDSRGVRASSGRGSTAGSVDGG